jgi:phosphoglycolate phosphatase
MCYYGLFRFWDSLIHRKCHHKASMIHRTFKSIIFDFDYTLADSSRGVIECINYALATMGMATVSDNAACRTIGMSLHDTFKVLTSLDAPERAAEFARLFILRADDVMVDSTEVFDYALPVISGLKQQDICIGIVSTKYRSRIEAVLARDGMLDSIDLIIGGEDVAQHKPHPEGLLKALEKLQTPSSSALYVGDSVVDAIVAERAGTRFVAVLSGTTPADAFAEYQPLEVIDKLSDLPGVLYHL